MITLQAHMVVKTEKRGEFLHQMKELIPASQAEAGNVSYKLFEDTDRQGHFVMLEEWLDAEAMKLHGASEHFIKFSSLAKEYLAEPMKLQRFEQPVN